MKKITVFLSLYPVTRDFFAENGYWGYPNSFKRQKIMGYASNHKVEIYDLLYIERPGMYGWGIRKTVVRIDGEISDKSSINGLISPKNIELILEQI